MSSIATIVESMKSNVSNAYDTIENKGVDLTGIDKNLENLSTQIDNIPQTTVAREWAPQPDWWDIDTILANDLEDYNGKFILLLDDSHDVLQLPLSYANIMDAEKITTSDGASYDNNGSRINYEINHTWDKTQDKACSLGYKTRYVIFYFKDAVFDLGVWSWQVLVDGLYLIVKNCNITGSGGYFLPQLWKAEAVKFKNVTIGANTDISFSEMNNIRVFKFENSTTSSKAPTGIFSNAPHLNKQDIVSYYSQLAGNKTDMQNSFTATEIEEITLKDTSNVTNMKNTFRRCRKLRKVQNLNLSSCVYANSCFYECASLQEIDLVDTSKVKEFNDMFSRCYSLKKIDALDFNSATNISSMFATNAGNASNIRCPLEEITNVYNIKISGLNFAHCPDLNYATLIKILNALYDYSESADTYTLTLGSINLAKLTAEEIAIGTAKGWTIS